MAGLSTSALAYDTSKQADLAAAMHSSDDRRAFAWDGSHVVIARATGAAQLATHPLRLNSDGDALPHHLTLADTTGDA